MAQNDGFESRTLSVALAPELLTAVVREGRHVVAWSEIRIVCEPGDDGWQAALAAFEAWVDRAGAGLRGVRMSVAVSTRWCRLAMLPWSDALLYADSAQRYQQDRFIQLYGNPAREWDIFSDDGGRGLPRLACAIDRQFARGLQAAARRQGHPHITIESVVSATARSMPPGLCDRFAIIEPGRAVLVARRHGRIAGVQAQACAGIWPAGLPQAWQHWMLRPAELGEVAQVVMFALDGAAPDRPGEGLVSADGSWHTGGHSAFFARSLHDQTEDNRTAGAARIAADRSDDPGAAAPGC